jgi:hypothetical protein
VSSGIYNQTAQGARVRLVATPLLGYVKSVETLVAAPTLPSLADSSETAEAVIAQAMGSIATEWSGMMGGLAARLASGSNRNADPATAAQVQAQMTAMLQDPKIANTPTATFLEAYLHSSGQPGAV